MSSSIKVIRPVTVDPSVIERVMGVVPLDVEHVDAPSIWVDGAFHPSASRWLFRKYRLRPVDATIKSHAARLSNYISFLRDECGLVGNEQSTSDVFMASAEDLRKFYRARQFTPETKVSSASWQAQLSTIKQFHEFLRDTYRLPLPFRLESFLNPVGMRVTSAVELRPRTRVGSRGTPVTPEFAEVLVQAAYRIDSTGRQLDSRTTDRDAAFVSLGLATGMRLSTLANITVYEMPPRVTDDFTVIRVPDFVTKGDAGGEAFVFAHRLGVVHNYINGQRADVIANARRPYRPTNPIQLLSADSETWEGMVDHRIWTMRWTESDAKVRRRLVCEDGSSPIVWLNGYVPSPIGVSRAGDITTDARDWARGHINADFPATFRTHDLRHTYATHLVVCMFKRTIADWVHPSVADAYRPTQLAGAVEMVKLSLGHASDASTKLYIQHASRFLDIDQRKFVKGE